MHLGEKILDVIVTFSINLKFIFTGVLISCGSPSICIAYFDVPLI
jgi:hypothetical protein